MADVFWGKSILEVLGQRLPQPRLQSLRHAARLQFGFRFRRRLRWFEFQGGHYVTRVASSEARLGAFLSPTVLSNT